MPVLIGQFVGTRRSELAGNHEADDATGHDILTRLIYASQLEGDKGLTDSELVRLAHLTTLTADFYMTTGHTLSATLALLALHNEEQDMAVKNILDILRDGRDPTFDDYPKLERVRACFQEAARMFPSTNLVTRDTAEAVVLSLPHTNGSEPLVVPPGVRILIDMIGIHYDEERFPDPERFDPSRWLGVPERDLTFFGIGPRACLARKFALTEVVLVLTMLLRDWKSVPTSSARTLGACGCTLATYGSPSSVAIASPTSAISPFVCGADAERKDRCGGGHHADLLTRGSVPEPQLSRVIRTNSVDLVLATAQHYQMRKVEFSLPRPGPNQDQLPPVKDCPFPTTVGIVGGGVAGLYAALILQDFEEYGYTCQVLEAEEAHIGGRLWTYQFPNGDPAVDFYDRGAMRFPETKFTERVFHLFSKLGIEKGGLLQPFIFS
ncbi:predicted protein, partial [Postia placenta Mad-698-R]